jgi:8-oxo-dGTP diphosphatase
MLKVVAAVLERDGKILIAQRAHPPELRGQWEFPGGKVEPGEALDVALARELEEEFGVVVRVGFEISHFQSDTLEIVFLNATLISGEPQALEHLALRWVDPLALNQVDFLPTNRAALLQLQKRF